MAEKPKLKGADEILNSIGKTKKDADAPARQPAFPEEDAFEQQGMAEQQESAEEPAPSEELISSSLDDRPRTRNRRAAARGAGSDKPEPVDRNPLDFGKYQLPKKRSAPVLQALEEAEAAAAQIPPAEGAPQTSERPAVRKPRRVRPEAEPAQQKTAGAEVPASGSALVDERAADKPVVVEAFEFEELSGQEDLQEDSAADAGAEVPSAEELFAIVKKSRGKRGTKKKQEADSAEEFFSKLTQQFSDPSDTDTPPRGTPAAMANDTGEDHSDVFLQAFEQQVREEESEKNADFKETLAEKFLRERKQYLEELGISPEEELSEQPQPKGRQRRRLDIQIQPEMHMQDDAPVTYGPSGQVRPMEPAEDDEGDTAAAMPLFDAAQAPREDGKKTGEDLLLELAALNSQQAARKIRSGAASQPPTQGTKKTARNRRTGKPMSTPTPRGGGRVGRTVVISAVAALVVLGLVAVPLLGRFAGGGEEPAAQWDTGDVVLDPVDTFTVFESHEYDVTRQVRDILVRKANIVLDNMEVDNHVVIDGIDTQGEVVLRNMTVGGTIYVRSCAVDTLRLDNVEAARVIISNLDKRVTVHATGDTSIGTIELKTPSTLQQLPGTTGLRVENVLVRKAEEATSLDVAFNDLELSGISVTGDAAVALSQSKVESISAEGNLVLSGDGSVLSLSLGAQNPGSRVALQLKNVLVSKLVVKSPLQADISATVDMISSSNDLYISGSGEIGTLLIGEGTGTLRMPVDISGVTVHALISDAQALVTVSGRGMVNELTANESVYAMGNKLSHLIVGANNVVYELEPDRITVRPGIRPATPASDNPNLDLTLTAEQNIQPTDVSDDEVATTCGHTRENGGFVKGDGSAANPWEITSAAQLAHIDSHLDGHFVQTADIDISDDSRFASGFTMIGGVDRPFTGTYDGGGYVILGLRITSDAQSVGLFSENKGTIRGVNIATGEIRATSSQRSFVGGITGVNDVGGVIEACSNGARVIGADSGYAGGIAGYNFTARIRNSYNFAKISGQSSVGGIVGVNKDNATIAGCYNVGIIEAVTEVGAVAGGNQNATITNSYFLAETAELGIGSGMGTVLERTSEQLSDPQMARDLAAGDDATPWSMPASGSYTYPVLKAPPQGVADAAPVEAPVVQEVG